MTNKPHRRETLRGLCALAALILLVAAGLFILNRRDTAAVEHACRREEYARRKDSIEQALSAREEQRKQWALDKAERQRKREKYLRDKEERERKRRAEDTITVVLHPFDPNTADSSELVHLGLRPWMARSVCRYRGAGGQFRKAEQFRKVYGMTDSLYAALKPYIVIHSDSVVTDSLPLLYMQQRKVDTVLQLNTTDTAELQLIRGIGRYTAKEIIRYRERLGGYVSVEQIREIPRLRNIDSLLPHLATDTLVIRPVYVNSQSVDRLSRHPYLSFEQAKGIYMFRRRHGKLQSTDDLLQIKDGRDILFNENDLRRLAPYLSFEDGW
ncbi:MAG: helix-hairpin-helix domain-containing protein [Paludibacteraceae bacterium]|nr:helix-hairpin-helix domain-containing protein [Paludibacteraceae bacterium]